MLFRSVKLPDTTPRWVYAAIVGSLMVSLVLWSWPELRAELLRRIKRDGPAAVANDRFPPGCIPINIGVPKSGNIAELRVATSRPFDELRSCNPRPVRDSGASRVLDIGAAQDGSTFKSFILLQLQGGATVFAIKDDAIGGAIVALRCNERPAVLRIDWNTIVPTKKMFEEAFVPNGVMDKIHMDSACKEGLR